MSAFILVADDDPFNLRLLRELCGQAGHQVQTAESGEEVLEFVSRRRPDLILLDLDMPGKSGLEVMEILRGDSALQSVPIIIVTAMGDVDARARGLELGAEDYVTKPYRVFEIQQRVRNVLRIQEAESKARQAKERVERLVQHSEPPPGGCGTSQQFILSLDYEFIRAARYKHPLSLLIVELLEAAPQQGKDAGPAPQLFGVAEALRSCLRGIDHLFRSDQFEFSIVLPETEQAGAKTVEERIRATLPEVLKHHARLLQPRVNVVSGTHPQDEANTGEALRKLVLKRLRDGRSG